MRGTETRLSKLEEQIVPTSPCHCKTLLVTQENGIEVLTLPACLQHKRTEPVELMRLCGVSIADL